MKKRRSWSTAASYAAVPRWTSPQPNGEEAESVQTDTVEEDMKDISPDRSSRDRSPSTRQLSKTSPSREREVSPANKPGQAKTEASASGKRDASPASKGQAKRKRK